MPSGNFGTVYGNSQNPQQEYTNALFAAVNDNDINEVNKILKDISILKLPRVIEQKQVPINKTALHIACENGNLDMVKALVKAGAISYAVDIYNVSPLGYAATEGHSDIVIYLCSLPHVNPNTVRTGVFADEMPLMYAAWKCNMEAVEALIKKGADVNAYKNADFFTPAIYAVYNYNGKDEADKIISLLVKNGAVLDKIFKNNYNKKYGEQYTPSLRNSEENISTSGGNPSSNRKSRKSRKSR
jgi:ankyrin repeat protein